MQNYTDEQKKEYLLRLAKEYYTQGDGYHAHKSKKDKWHFGYSNDYPLQHGAGENMILPDRMVEIIMANCVIGR